MRSILVAALVLTASVAHAQTTSTITGTVTDSITATPLASSGDTVFAVGLYSSSGQLLSSAQTNVSGVYQMSGINPGTYFLKITSSPGYVTELHNDIVCIAADCPVTVGAPVTLTAGANPTIDFALARAGGFSGAVRRSNNNPLGGLKVEVYNVWTSYVKYVVAGAGGFYSVDGLAEGVYFARVVPGDSFKPTDLLYELFPNIYCPPTPPTPGSACRIAWGTPITVIAGSTSLGIDFALDPAGAISGTVTATDGGAPLNLVQVVAHAGETQVGQATTNTSGQYTITGLSPGTYRVRTNVPAGNYVNEWHNNQCVGCTGTPAAIAVASGVNVGGIDFSLASGGVITGTIACPTGLALPGVVFPEIYAYNASGALVRKWSNPGEACREGFSSASYAIEGLPAGQYFLLARDVPFDPGEPFGFPRPSGGAFVDHLHGGTICVTTDCDVRRAVPVNVPAAGITAGVDFTATFGAGSQLIPEVVPPVRMFDARGVELESVRAPRAGVISPGQYITGVPPGVYYARKGDQINGGTVCPDCPPTSGTPIVIRPGQTTFTLTFSTTTSGHQIAGNVSAANGSGPLSTITVQAYTDAAVLAGSALTDLFGNYSIGPLRAGTYFLRTLNDRGFVDEIYPDGGCPSCDVRTGTPVVVASSDVTGIDFGLLFGGVLAGKVTDADGVAVGPTPVTIFTAGGTLAGRASASSDGAYRLTLAPGSYRARAEPTATHGAEIFSEQSCTSAACDVSAGTPIALSIAATTPNINFTVPSCSAMTLSPSILASAVVGRPYRQVFTVTGGAAPIAYDLTAGVLPAGVTLSATGLLDGTPTVDGRYEVSVAARDANGCATARTLVVDVQECAFVLSPASATVPAAGSGNLPITILGPCNFQAVLNRPSWVSEFDNRPGHIELIVAPNTAAAPRSATITIGRRVFEVRQAGTSSQAPFGSFDAPIDGSQVAGSVALGGWALDDLEVARVPIYRDPVNGEGSAQVFVGNAVFVRGARPDVARAYPTYSLNDRAGWGFLVLTNMLPNQGNGPFRIYAYADDAEGHRTLLGAKTIVGVNASSVDPFGAIDTPAQGATISGTSYINFGWALTPQPKIIPFDGSTMHVIVDGISIGHPSYNHFRSDVSGLFPGLANSGGPVGFKMIDTTALAEGQHTIAWVVYDSQDAGAGIGSRYFTVANSADAQPADEGGIESGRRTESLAAARAENEDARVIRLAHLEHLKLELEGDVAAQECPATWAGYLAEKETLGRLPVGATLDPHGTFFWQPGPGFIGTFPLHFVRTACDGGKRSVEVRVVISK